MRREAREIFDAALAASDARAAVLRAIEVEGGRLRACGEEFELRGHSPLKVYAVALGKAAAAMASGLEARLGENIKAGVMSAPPSPVELPPRWRVFEGGHPLPDAGSLDAARAALELLRGADDPSSLVVFLVSGGGSAMMEWPRDPRVTLEDLREANRVLVTCGAGIDEVNAVRRAFSAVKGGGLSGAAPNARQFTLIISDVNRGPGSEADVASGPTLPPRAAHDARAVVSRYRLAPRLPPSILRAVEEYAPPPAVNRGAHGVLLDNLSAIEAAAAAARARGYAVEIAEDICEQDAAEGASLMVDRLAELQDREGARVCLVSGGEFACPVRGRGVGGRNSETALRCAFEFEMLKGDAVALCAGTDGVDGNSPAAGALADTSTLRRARAADLDAAKSLEDSDAFTFFDALGDAVTTGPTGTNVRDLRILLAG
jgi:hydroxypyruvate reductase